VIVGAITTAGVPRISVTLAGQSWPAIIDTGFNGDLELPLNLSPLVNARFLYRARSLLAGGQSIDEDLYRIDFPFDGQTIVAEATFVPGGEILIGTHLLRQHRLEMNFVAKPLLLERVILRLLER